MQRRVRTVISECDKGRFVLEPTEWPIAPLSERQKNNYLAFMKAGLDYGVI